jgi:hypothetical protein
MAHPRRLVASVFLAAGVLLVLVGFIAALGFSLTGTLTSVAATVALLYAGAVWFRQAPETAAHAPTPIVVFDRDCRAVTGPAAGQFLALQYPEMLRPEIERRCRAALGGAGERFFCVQNGRSVVFDALPVRNAEGTVVYGLLLAAESTAWAGGAPPGGDRDVRGRMADCGPLAQW